MEIGKCIKRLRLENDMTQKELARKLGLTSKMISFYENAERIPPLDIVLKLVSIFNVSSDYLLGIANNKTVSNYDFTKLPDGSNILLETYKELDIIHQRTLLHSAFSLLEDQKITPK